MIHGIHDSVAPLTDEERKLYEKIEFDMEGYRKDIGAAKLLHSKKAGDYFLLVILHNDNKKWFSSLKYIVVFNLN